MTSMSLRLECFTTFWVPFFLQLETHESMSGWTMLHSRRLGKMAPIGIHLLIKRWKGWKKCLVLEILLFTWSMSHLPKMSLTRSPVLCLTLTVLCARLCGHEFNQDSARTRLILCLWTATVAEAGMEISCLTTRLGRPLILQEQMSLHSRYLVGIRSTFFPPCVLVGPRLRYFLDQCHNFAFTIIVPRLYPCRYWWTILQALVIDSLLLGRKGDPSVSFPLLPGFHC